MKKYYSLTTYLVFGVVSILITFYYPYLSQEVGLSLTDLGMVVSVGAIFTVISQPILTSFYSKAKNKKRFIIYYLISVSIAIIGLLSINKEIAIIFSPIYGALLVPLSGIFEVYIEELSVKSGFEFSNIRKWGSIGYGCVVLIAGLIISRFGYTMIYIFAILIIVLMLLIISLKFKNINTDQNKSENVKLKDLFKNKKVILLVIIIFLSIGSYMGVDFAYSSYLANITNDIELANKIYSGSIGVRVFVEALAFLLVGKYLSKANAKTCLVTAFAVAGIKMLLFYTGNIPLIILGDQLHGVMFALYLTFLFKYLREILKPEYIASTFSVLSVLTSGGANFIYPSIYSFVQINFGYRNMYFVAFILIIISIGISIIYLPINKTKEVTDNCEKIS